MLPSGLMGLMLTGMYFATASSANTTLNVAAAVFTNDIYKRVIKSEASEKQLMKIARLSSWVFGILMIVIALLVPYMGGMVEVVLSVAAVTAGPLLAPPIWALFSKRLSGRATIWITLSTLFINIIFKIIMPFVNGFRLDRAEEMVVGIGVPTLLLLINELLQKSRMAKSEDYDN
ncbi:MAG TPA: sodium transporter, partial [Sphingobacterium sp.]|nr:sodium transporter [Sphingobacterium sp.]